MSHKVIVMAISLMNENGETKLYLKEPGSSNVFTLTDYKPEKFPIKVYIDIENLEAVSCQ